MVTKNVQTPDFQHNPGVLIGKDQMAGYLVFVKAILKETNKIKQPTSAPTS